MVALKINNATDMLGIVDVQPDFMPGGKLPVVDGDQVVPVINKLLADRFSYAFATQDWHPEGHSSFASSHPGKLVFETVELPYGSQTLWPDHCIQTTPGADLHSALDHSKINLIVRKGFRPEVDSYSAFFENDHKTTTGLHGWLQARGVRRLFLSGISTDYCVAYSAEDALNLGYQVFLVEDACRGIHMPLESGGTTVDAAKRRLLAAGAILIDSSAIGS